MKEGRKVSLRQEIRKRWFFYLIPIPGIICLLLFSYFPMAGLYVVFERYTYQGGLFGSEFVGLQNFKFFFMNIDNALRATRNTLVINGLSIVIGVVVNVGLAILINEISSKRFRKVTQTVMLFPKHLLEQLDKTDVKNDPFIWSVPKMYAEDETIEILSVPISDTWYSSENFTGMAVLNVDLEKFRERLFSDQQNDRFRTLILNEDGLVISHSSEEEIGKDYSEEKWFQKVLAGEKRFTVSDGEGSWEFQVLESGVSGYYLIAQSDYVSQILNINYAVYILAVALAIAVALVVLLLFVVSRRIFQPFNTMVRKLKKTDAEEEFRDAADKGEPAQDEIAFLEQVYSGMYSHLEILRQRREADILVKNLLLGNQKELSVMLSSSGIIQEGHPFIMALIYMENEEKKDTFSMQEYDMVRAMVSGAYTTALEAAGHCTCLDVGLRRVLFFVQSGDEKSVMQVAGEAGESVRHISQVRCCAIISAPQEDGRHCVSVFQRLDNSLKTRYLCGIWDAALLEETSQEGAVQAARGSRL